MKHLLIPFLFISTAVFAQNTANKIEKYKINPELAYPFEKPLLGKVKRVHTAHYSIAVTVLKDTIKREHFDENYMPTKEGCILENFIDKFYTG